MTSGPQRGSGRMIGLILVASVATLVPGVAIVGILCFPSAPRPPDVDRVPSLNYPWDEHPWESPH